MRTFTLEEARATLAAMRPDLEELSAVAKRGLELQRAAATAARGTDADGNLVADPWAEGADALEELNARFAFLLERMAGAGIDVKDPARGLIDFPHEREGRVVYLCYELGEPDIRYWHPMETGFAGRQPL